MGKFNNSELDKKSWDRLESLAQKDPAIKTVWEKYKWLYSSADIKAIKTIDKWIDFTEAAIDVACSPDTFDDGEDFDDIPVGKNLSQHDLMKLAAKRMLQDKDDKTADRINVMLKSYYENIRQRNMIISKLSEEDMTELEANYLLQRARERQEEND